MIFIFHGMPTSRKVRRAVYVIRIYFPLLTFSFYQIIYQNEKIRNSRFYHSFAKKSLFVTAWTSQLLFSFFRLVLCVPPWVKMSKGDNVTVEKCYFNMWPYFDLWFQIFHPPPLEYMHITPLLGLIGFRRNKVR